MPPDQIDSRNLMEDLSQEVCELQYEIEVLRASNSKLQEELCFQRSRYDGCHQKMRYEKFYAKAFGSTFICNNNTWTQFVP